ncbi:ABC transporter ATP-binding protein/permease [Lactococcus paracarnosus]|uniref:ABC transporter ATP-binding protein n=1 Tax=Pseudolactococcus paracarnosus TaxID=2749962 RepID=A0A7L4WGD0_9LACT|nr:ABC transporter ATP-binding protein/permease [Lactococcus paracarnosus]SPC35181.1 ABC transporter ATP-binding and permease protein [Lactococcus piscium]MCJ1978012.1 ATP-binding cassette domain-containing protein [Lactococcus paracarnosus]MCJ1984156.1 ATP-binding cassette domain-containing protein [Lactococcus paracarnosus]MCJ1994282.1 ATP-binding cassette domain-containing protein [Lactococcus paracarnosus]MCJ1998297.1 ATP-binding cassette domain-containing protein [Lactococcus paracarnosus
MSILELKNIKKSYFLGKEEFPVLKGLALSFDKGDFVSILGESGGGKSTLMNIIGGLDRKYDGEVIVNGIKQADKKEKSMDEYRRDTVGFIFQSFNLVSYLSVLDNVLISLKMTNLSHKAQVKKAEELLKQVGLFEHKKKNPNQLSGGQKQRVAIARALANDPDIIIADEPTGALDSQNTQDVLGILSDIAKSGKTVIVVTHSQEVADYGTRIVHLADGQVTSDERIKPSYATTEKPREFKTKTLSFGAKARIASQHFLNNWKQNLMIMIGVAIGLFSVMFFLGLGNGAKGYMNKMVTDLANPNVPIVMKRITDDNKKTNEAAMSESQQTLAANTEKTAISDSLTKKVSELDHVKKVEKGFTIVPTEAVANVGTAKTPFTQLQTWTDVNTDNSLLVGKKPGNNEVVIPDTIAKKWDKSNWKKIVGQSMDLTYKMMSSDGKLVTLTQTVKVSGVVKGNPGTVSLNMNFKTSQDLFKANGLVSQPNFIVPTVDDSHNVDAVVKKIQALKTDGKKDFVTFSLGAVLEPINTITSIVTIVLAMIAGISLLVSLMMIIATTYMSVAERTKEIGILRALGARKKDIRWLFVIETIILGLASAVLGIIVALIGQTVVNSAVSNLIDKYNIIQVSAGAIIGSVIIAIVIALFASLMPAGKAANLNPIEALSND